MCSPSVDSTSKPVRSDRRTGEHVDAERVDLHGLPPASTMGTLGHRTSTYWRPPRPRGAAACLRPINCPTHPAGSGINHLALVTPDMDATVRFYVGRARHAPRRHHDGRARCATTSSRWRRGNTVAFFEVEGAETFAKPAGGPSDRAIQLDHISFDVPDEHALEMLRKRLLAAGSEVTDGRRPRVHPLGLLHRPERHRARGVVVGRRRHRPPDRLHRRARCSAIPTRCPRSPSSRPAASTSSRRPGSPDSSR